MAGGLVARIQNQLIVFFTITAPKHLNHKTQPGRIRLLLLVIGVLFLGYFVTNSGNSASGGQGLIGSGRANGVQSSNFNANGGGIEFFDDDDDEGDDEGDAVSPSKKARKASSSDDDDDDDDEEGDDGEEDEQDDPDSAVDIATQQKELLKSSGPGLVKFFESYHTEAEIHQHLANVVNVYQHLPGFLTSIKIGKTSEGNDIVAYSVGKGQSKKGIFVVGTENGSEWSSAASLTYFIMRMTQLYGIKLEVTTVLDQVKFYVIPVANPDGFAYTHGKSHGARYWSKNRASATVHHKKVHGVDLLSDWKLASQLEINAIEAFALKNKARIQGFATIRCCTGLVSIPRKKLCSDSSVFASQQALGKQLVTKMSQEIAGRQIHKFSLTVGKDSKSSATAAQNTAITWAAQHLGTHMAFEIFTRPGSSKKKHSSSHEKSSVVIPESDIVESSRDIAFGLLEFGSYIATSTVKRNLCDTSGGNFDDESHADSDASETADESGDDEEEEEVGEGADESDSLDDEGDSDSGDDSEMDEGDEDEGDEDGDSHSDDTAVGDDNNAGDQEDDYDDDSNEEKHKDGEFDESVDDQDEDKSDVDDDDDSAVKLSPSSLTSQATSDIGDHDLDFAKQFAKLRGVNAPLLSVSELPPADGSGPYALYFAYSVDMYYNVLLNAGVKSAKKVVNGRLWGYTYDYTYYSQMVWHSGVADIVKSRQGYTMGVVYRINKSELDVLDAHNLVGGGKIERIKVIVADKLDNKYEAYTYKVRVKTSGSDIQEKFKRYHPSRQYRNCVIKGARQQHLPNDYIENKLYGISPMFSDKIGGTKYRNERLGALCDVKQ